jgi:hypothetical protein
MDSASRSRAITLPFSWSYSSIGFPVRHATWGNKVEIVEPISLRERLTTELRVALAHHEEPLRFAYTVATKKVS